MNRYLNAALLGLIWSASAMTALTAHAASNPQSLIDIYQEALAHDPTLASALDANQAAQEIIEQAKALYRPTINLNAGTTATQSDIRFLDSSSSNNPFRFQGRSNYEGYTYGVDARQPIFRKQSLV